MRHRSEKLSMLGRELELLMGERQTLLQVVGATAALIASPDSSQLPDETLQDALAAVHAEIEEEPVVIN